MINKIGKKYHKKSEGIKSFEFFKFVLLFQIIKMSFGKKSNFLSIL